MTLPPRYSRTREYNIWRHMRSRCSDPNNDAFEYYGGRGIKVCRRWQTSFANFISDMGWCPTPLHTLDRFPNQNGDYKPSNCRWATRAEQGANTRANRHVLIGDNKVHVAKACRDLGLNENSVRYRVRAGWSPSEIVSVPIRKRRNIPAKIRRKIKAYRGASQDKIASIFGVSQSAVSEIRRGHR